MVCILLWAFAILYFTARGISLVLWEILLQTMSTITYSKDLHAGIIVIAVLLAVLLVFAPVLFGGKRK